MRPEPPINGFPTALLMSLVCLAWSVSAATGVTLHCQIRDEQTGELAPCTVRITDALGKTVIEQDSFHAGFRCAGEFTKELPPGQTHIHITRGFETVAVRKDVELVAGREASFNFVLRRKVDLRKRGWYAGDSHVHMLHGERTVPVSFDFIALTARAEDLQYLSLAQAWTIDDPTPEALTSELQPRSTAGCILTWNLEAPKNYYKGDAGRCLGHCWNMGMTGRTKDGADVIRILIDASAWDYESRKPTYANFESHRLIHEQGGAVFYTHPARWWTGSWGGQGGYPKVEKMRVSNMAVELPLDTALGPTFDGLDVITGPGEFEANQKAFQLWSMLLNHGYRLAATGSSDACFDRPGGAAPGVPRTYTFIPDGFSIKKATRATAAGRTVVSTGPLLVATIDGKPPGSVVKTGKQPHNLDIESWSCGEDEPGITGIDVFRNGVIYTNWTFNVAVSSIRTNLAIMESDRAWFCVRVRQAGPKQRRAISSAFYFGDFQPPPPARAQVQARILDAQSGAPLKGTVTELEYFGTVAKPGRTHHLPSGEGVLNVPGSVRLRAEAPGHAAIVLSPVLDNSRLMDTLTHLSDSELLDWSTFERVRRELGSVTLTFRLEETAR
jgi:hypothetical protein